MIVKNEEHVIIRCLRSVKHLIDKWVICDTGSTDNTKNLIKEYLKDIPGKLIEDPWIDDYSHSRNVALNNIDVDVTHVLFIDADDELIIPENYKLPNNLDSDTYHIKYVTPDQTCYKKPLLININSNSINRWRWLSPIHEFISSENNNIKHDFLENIYIKVNFDGGSNKDKFKFIKRAIILENFYKIKTFDEKNETDIKLRNHILVHLAEEFSFAGFHEIGLKYYKLILNLDAWDEQIYNAKINIAKLMEKLNYDSNEIVDAYLSAYNFRPSRAEPLVYLGIYHRSRNEFNLGYIYLKQAEKIKFPNNDTLFVEQDIYNYIRYDELSIAAWHIGNKKESLKNCVKILSEGFLPKHHEFRVKENLKYSIS